MRFFTSLALAALGLTASALPAAAGTLLVPQQFPTIQGALNAARPGDTVLVSAKPRGGVYSEAVTIYTPHVTLQGRNSPIIDGSKLGTVVTPFPSYSYTVFPNGIDIQADHVSVLGMTVQGFAGSVQGDSGTGIHVGTLAASGEVSFSDITISGNTLKNNGDGLMISGYNGSDPLFGGGGTYLKGYQVIGNTFMGSGNSGATIAGASVSVIGNKASGNASTGLNVTGIGVTVSGNESGGNGAGLVVNDAAPNYNPAVNTPSSPNPAPTVTSFNYVHDNSGYGIEVEGTQAVLGNVVANSIVHGLYLSYADYSTVSGNVITGTALVGSGDGDGAGLYAEYSAAYYGGDSGVKVSLNQISGNAGDGISFFEYAGGVISLNNVTGNQGIGIHLSAYTSNYGNYGYAPTTVTQNRALHNALFDARDDAAATDNVTEGINTYYGDSAPLYNVWTKDVFGTTDPAGLGK